MRLGARNRFLCVLNQTCARVPDVSSQRASIGLAEQGAIAVHSTRLPRYRHKCQLEELDDQVCQDVLRAVHRQQPKSGSAEIREQGDRRQVAG
jgi:hypothetical protein